MNAHGSVSLQWQSNTLIISTHGPFNLEGITQSFDAIKKSVFERNVSEWHHVDFLDENTLGSPDVMKVIGEFYQWANDNNCSTTGIYCSNPIQKSMLQDFVLLINFDIKIFNDKQETLHYIAELSQ